MTETIHQQLHGYEGGHRLLTTTKTLSRADQDTIDRLSDIAGPLSPGEKFTPYLTGYPLPSKEHYVLARTEQDLAAPRAGCVLTHSFLVPLKIWKQQDRAFAYLRALQHAEVGERGLLDSQVAAPRTLAPITAPFLVELVEALFLEQRMPVVAFNVQNGEEIVSRILTAFWPAMRARFSFCTYTLAPRLLSGAPFDLLLAPLSARSRFSDWPGRRLEASKKTASARHRWTEALTERIFRSEGLPALITETELLSPEDTKLDESALRLSLLWDELKSKAPTSPTASLGLIDIAKSRGALGRTWDALNPIVVDALRQVLTMKDDDAWVFLTALGVKLEGEVPDKFLTERLPNAAATLTGRDPVQALIVLNREEFRSEEIRKALYRSVAKQLSKADFPEIAGPLAHFDPERLVLLLVSDAALANKAFTTELEPIAGALAQHIETGLSHLNGAAALEDARKVFISAIRGDQHAHILRELLRDAAPADVLAAFSNLWQDKRLGSGLIADALCDAALKEEVAFEALQLINSGQPQPGSVHAIHRLLRPRAADLDWLLHADGLVGDDRPAFLNRFTAKQNLASLRACFSDEKNWMEAIELLLTDDNYGETVSILLSLHERHSNWKLEKCLEAFAVSPNGKAGSLIDQVLAILADDEPLRPDLVAAAFKQLISRVSAVTVFRRVASVPVLNAILASLDELSPDEVRSLTAELEAVTRYCTAFGPGSLTEKSAASLAKLVSQATPGSGQHLRACANCLSFAMADKNNPVSPLIITAFPPLYRELSHDTDIFDLFRVFLFIDWDKCKTARNELIEAFLSSKWPPHHLAIVADETGDLDRFIDRLQRDYRGRNYLQLMLADAEVVPDVIEERIMKSLYGATK